MHHRRRNDLVMRFLLAAPHGIRLLAVISMRRCLPNTPTPRPIAPHCPSCQLISSSPFPMAGQFCPQGLAPSLSHGRRRRVLVTMPMTHQPLPLSSWLAEPGSVKKIGISTVVFARSGDINAVTAAVI